MLHVITQKCDNPIAKAQNFVKYHKLKRFKRLINVINLNTPKIRSIYMRNSIQAIPKAVQILVTKGRIYTIKQVKKKQRSMALQTAALRRFNCVT